MGVPKLKTKIDVAEYLDGEQIAATRSEYIYGEVYAMAGASDRHHRIAANLFISLDGHTRNSKNCEAFMTDMKVSVSESTYYYPDVFVTCNEIPESPYYRKQPVLVIEVASPATRDIDRREKLLAYQQMPSVSEYVIVEQDKISIELHRRQPDGRWITYYYNNSDMDETIEFRSVGSETDLATIYDRVSFDQTTAD